MDTRWFQDFVTLAEVRNFTRAAELRNVSQAAFSRRVQALEQWIGARLIDRTSFPTRLTDAGEQFRDVAIRLINQISEAKTEIGGDRSRDHVRIAMPYALATTRLPDWWSAWTGTGAPTCSIEVGSVHDTVSALTAGAVDLLIGFHQAAHPVQIDAARFERHVIDTEVIRPYAARRLVESGELRFPGSATQPIPLLMYSPSGYFARLVETAIENAPVPLFGERKFEVEMSDVLGDLAEQGHGVAWLSTSAFRRGRLPSLTPLGDSQWDIEVSVVAYRAKQRPRRVTDDLWKRIVDSRGGG